MDLGTHNAISGKLEQCKLTGWLSDYLIAWHGPSGSLSPNITAWGAHGRSEDEVRAYLTGLLTGIVADGAIEVEAA